MSLPDGTLYVVGVDARRNRLVAPQERPAGPGDPVWWEDGTETAFDAVEADDDVVAAWETAPWPFDPAAPWLRTPADVKAARAARA